MPNYMEILGSFGNHAFSNPMDPHEENSGLKGLRSGANLFAITADYSHGRAAVPAPRKAKAMKRWGR
jgi:hypothetical protein